MRINQGSVLSPFLFTIVVDIDTELAWEGMLSDMLHANDSMLLTCNTL